MKHFLLLLIAPLLLTQFSAASKNESEAQTYLKLYSTATGTGSSRVENWLLANNGTRRIQATIEIIDSPEDSKNYREKKDVIVEAKTSLPLGLRSKNGSAPNTIIVMKAAFIP